MKIILPFLLLIFFSACDNPSTENCHGGLSLEDSLHVDSLIQNLNESPDVSIASEERQLLIDLLANPIDLENYKAEYGTSNSGNAIQEESYFQPDTVGFYYQYMLFHKLRNLLESHPSESDLFQNFRIITYKYGETVGNFYDTNEEFIAIECAMKNETLGELDLVGMELNEVEDKFGVPDRIGTMQSFYFANQTVLALNFGAAIDSQNNRSEVTWFKIVHVNEAFNLDDPIPTYLLNYE
ncbi:MAG: hypothetical protein GQ574_19110 [Crocinitomix sp.]|nr:hypothetical protein [Crocinitomix sp.]